MTKTDIIRAAFRAWGRELYRKTSLSRVAAELGVTKTALYRHFHNKQSLLNEMYEYFFDNFTGSIGPLYQEALETADAAERYLIISRAFAGYFYKNPEAFLFSLIRVFGNGNMREQLESRGVDIEKLIRLENGASAPEGAYFHEPLQFVISTFTFWVANFLRCRNLPPNRQEFDPPGPEETERDLDFQRRLLAGGLGFSRDRIGAMDFPALEACAASRLPAFSENDKLLRAVGEAVAEAGPWNATMDMVARRSGLSKSGLYAHFKSRQDMLAQLFFTEFERLIGYANECKAFSSAPEDRLYLAIIACAEYLRSRSHILVALDWLRTRNLDLGIQNPPSINRLLLNIDFGAVCTELGAAADPAAEALLENVAQWITFLVVNTMMWQYREEKNLNSAAERIKATPIENFRRVFRFVTLGLKGM
jgi:AcrR family transcriptional regulator